MLILSGLIVLFLSGLSFFGGMILPIGIAFIAPSVFIGLVFTVYFIVISVKKRMLNVFVFLLVPIIVSGLMGYNFDKMQTENTKKEIIEIKKHIEQYYKENGKLPSEDDEYHQKKRIRIYDLGNGKFELYYKDAMTRKGEDIIIFRPRP